MKCQVDAMSSKLNVQFVLVKQQIVKMGSLHISKLIKNEVDQMVS
jgi:hypothetical protein